MSGSGTQKRVLTTQEVQQVRFRAMMRPDGEPSHSAAAASAAAHVPTAACPHRSPASVLPWQMLEENAKMIAAIVENQNLGKLDQCVE